MLSFPVEVAQRVSRARYLHFHTPRCQCHLLRVPWVIMQLFPEKASTSTIRMICKRSKESLRDGPGSDLAECLPDKSKQQFWASKPCNCVLQVEKCEKVENLLPVLPGFFGLLPPYQWWFLLMRSRCRSPCPRTLV